MHPMTVEKRLHELGLLDSLRGHLRPRDEVKAGGVRRYAVLRCAEGLAFTVVMAKWFGNGSAELDGFAGIASHDDLISRAATGHVLAIPRGDSVEIRDFQSIVPKASIDGTVELIEVEHLEL